VQRYCFFYEHANFVALFVKKRVKKRCGKISRKDFGADEYGHDIFLLWLIKSGKTVVSLHFEKNTSFNFMKIFTNEEIRGIDRFTIDEEGIPAAELIQRVAEGVTGEIVKRWTPARPVTVFAGPGNNGADALAVARMLTEQGFDPLVYLFNIRGNSLNRECRDQRDQLLASGRSRLIEIIDSMEQPELTSRHLVVDGLFGSGLRDPLSGGFKTLVQDINESGADVVSIDIPSGLFADWNPTTITRNVVHATITCAVQFPRLSFFMADNADIVGTVKLIDIGLSKTAVRDTPSKFHLVEAKDIKHVIRRRKPFSSKADYGNALLIAGSYGMMGAAVLASEGALRAGVGKLLVHSPRCGFNILQSVVPEAMYHPDKNDIIITDLNLSREYHAVGIGPGLGTADLTVMAVENLLKRYRFPIVIDADALNCISRRPTMLGLLVPGSVLTPHAGEFDRLFGAQPTAESRLIKAIEISRKYNVIIVLKGHYTAVVRPDGKVFFNSTGGPELATPGSGDVLTGIIVGLMAQGYTPEMSAIIGVYIHGLAGEIASRELGNFSVNSRDIAGAIAQAIKSLLN